MFFNKKIKKLETDLRYVEKEFYRINNELQLYKNLYKEQIEKANSSEYLIEENQKLIEWIQQILKASKIIEANGEIITIPVNKYTEYLYNPYKIESANTNRQIINIPSIKFVIGGGVNE